MSKLTFKNSKGNNLSAVLSNPTNNKENPIIIICHGFSSNKDRPRYKLLAKLLNQKKISTFCFDFYGHGESEGKFEDITISEAVDDIFRAYEFLKKKGYKKIGLVGVSFGGIASLLAAAELPDLRVLVLGAPVSDYREVADITWGKNEIKNWKKTGYTYYVTHEGKKLKLNLEFLKDFENHEVYTEIKKIKAPTTIIHGDKDEVVPIHQSIRVSEVIPTCHLVILKGVDHRTSNPLMLLKMAKIGTDFIAEHAF